jgi:hypothetical protein
MNVEERAKLRLECLKIAQNYSTTKEDLVKNTEELIRLVGC